MPLSPFKGSSSNGAGAGGSSEDGGRKSSLKNADRVRKDRKDRSRSPVGEERADMEEDPDELEVVPVTGTIPPPFPVLSLEVPSQILKLVLVVRMGKGR